MRLPPVSVVVVSRARPTALIRCLTGLSQLDYPQTEVIVVACPEGQAAVEGLPFSGQIKLVAFDEPNISVARNLGIARAAGEIVAFIDDDAVPEPLWLRHLAAPFGVSDVAAAGGYVLGRNGISFQWRARSVDRQGNATDLEIPSDAPVVLHPDQNRAIKTEGTNMALRRDVLADLGGFDPAYRFYLDETDLNMRLADEGLATAIVPLAQVHHGYESSIRRSKDRTPRDLTEIAASTAVFLRKFCAKERQNYSWATFRARQRNRVLRFMQRGPLGPDDVHRLLRGLDAGYQEGQSRTLHPLPRLPRSSDGFLPFPNRNEAPRRVLAGRIWQSSTLRERAKKHAADGEIVSLCLFSPSAKFHRVAFSTDGYWLQTGGLWGKSNRDERLFRPWTFQNRVKKETNRVINLRGQNFDTIHT